jgi:hypothetical protein
VKAAAIWPVAFMYNAPLLRSGPAMFFVDSRAQFFRPLTTKYRAQVAECLCLLHQRLYGAAAEYGQSLSRDQLLDIFEEALARSPVLEGEESEQEQRFKSLREQARWILQILLENGWGP